jgi:methyltransferase (TIGR00027 family)
MTKLNTVSETALITLRARAIETGKPSPILQDPECLRLLNSIGELDLSAHQLRFLNRNLPRSLTTYIALRARKYDQWSAEFLRKNPKGLVVSLGAGFDTRYWRISADKEQYIEIDLPEVIETKKQLLGDTLSYPVHGCSVLDEQWMEEISHRQKEGILFLAEGLLMYLPERDVIQFFKTLASTFSASGMVFEAVHKKYTRGMRKRMVESKMKRRSGTEAGTSFQYGLTDGKEVESYAGNIRVTGEWSYFEEPEVQPKLLRLLRRFKAFTRTQWTVRAIIE